MSAPNIPSWAGPPPDNEFELKNKLSSGPETIKFNERYAGIPPPQPPFTVETLRIREAGICISHLIVGRSSSDATVTIASTTASRVHAL
eukprot:3869136-Rhodomonas_salina.1